MRQRSPASSRRDAALPRDSSSAADALLHRTVLPTSSVSATTEEATLVHAEVGDGPATLAATLARSCSPDAATRKQGAPPHRRHSPHNCTAHVPLPPFAAEEALTAAKLQPQFCILLLQLIGQDAELPVRQAAAVYCKNLTRQHWEPADEGAPSIDASVKGQVKDGLLSLFLLVPELLQAQLGEGMALIAQHDFPAKWNTLLGSLVTQIDGALGATPRDYAKVTGLLRIAHSIFKRYRHEFKSDELFAEIKYVLESFSAPLLALLKAAIVDLRALPPSAADKAPTPTAPTPSPARTLVGCITVVAQVFYDLSFQDLPESFEDHLGEWMEGFLVVLQYRNTFMAMDDDSSRGHLVLQARTAAARAGGRQRIGPAITTPPPRPRSPSPTALSRAQSRWSTARAYMSKYEEEFEPFLNGLMSEVWQVLMATSLAPHEDLLVTTAVKFLTTVGTSVHHALFAQPGILQGICRRSSRRTSN